MWIETYHRFVDEAAFLAACQTAGWTCPPGQNPELLQGVAVDILGPIVAPAQVGAGGAPIAGDVIDPRYHVNLACHGRDPNSAFQASLVIPASPARRWDVTAVAEPQPPVPSVIPAWQGKAALREAGLLDAVEASVAAAGGRVQDAWTGASEWSRNSDFLLSLTPSLRLTNHDVDRLFLLASEIKS